MRHTVSCLVISALFVAACGGNVLVSESGGPGPESTIDGKSPFTTLYSKVTLDGSQCLPRAPDRMCRVLVVSRRCVGEDGLRESEPSDAEAIAGLVTIEPGSRVCEVAQMSPGLCLSRRGPAWCYVAGGCSPGGASACAHALCPSQGMGPALAALGPAYLACDQ
ncbi:MAG: hypothetical protein JST00_48190 [Deltaproteobacteria bacterium]|nr:hypothetical protein [Deltaproteobacteria bacterium]